jgi:hypothetical protein
MVCYWMVCYGLPGSETCGQYERSVRVWFVVGTCIIAYVCIITDSDKQYARESD